MFSILINHLILILGLSLKRWTKKIYHMEADEKSDDLKMQSVLEFTKNAKKLQFIELK